MTKRKVLIATIFASIMVVSSLVVFLAPIGSQAATAEYYDGSHQAPERTCFQTQIRHVQCTYSPYYGLDCEEYYYPSSHCFD